MDGRDVRAYSFDELRGKIGIVPQKAVLFKGTIEDNLRWGNPDATAEDMEEALNAAQAMAFVREKAGGLKPLFFRAGVTFPGDSVSV